MHVSPNKLIEQEFYALDKSTRIVCLHPRYRQQHMALDWLVKQEGCVYVRFAGHNLNLQALNLQFEHAIQQQIGDDGALRVLILDELDRACHEADNAFLQDLLTRFNNVRVVLLSRFVLRSILSNADLKKQLCILPVNQSGLMLDYVQYHDRDVNLLEVNALGDGRVLLNGKLIDSWDGQLPRALFFYLVDRLMVTRNEIFEVFWPNLKVTDATNVFHVTKRKISEVLGIDLTTYHSGFYHISPKIELVYDVTRFSEAARDSMVLSGKDAVDKLNEAINLYRGDFLLSSQYDWISRRRHELSQTYSETMIHLAKAKKDEGEKDAALGLFLRASNKNLQREDVVFWIMELMQDKGLYSDALAIYDRLKQSLNTTLGVNPAPMLAELALSLESLLPQD